MAKVAKKTEDLERANIIGDMWECPICGERDYTDDIDEDQETVWCGGCGTKLKINL